MWPKLICYQHSSTYYYAVLLLESHTWGIYASSQPREKEKWDFCLFVCLFVCHALHIEQTFSHSNGDIVSICRLNLMRISPFFRGRNALSDI